MATTFKPIPAQDAKWLDSAGRPTPEFYDYARKIDTILRSLDTMVRTGAFGPLTNGGQFGPLVSAADDAAALAAGIQIGGLYRTASAVKIRVA